MACWISGPQVLISLWYSFGKNMHINLAIQLSLENIHNRKSILQLSKIFTRGETMHMRHTYKRVFLYLWYNIVLFWFVFWLYNAIPLQSSFSSFSRNSKLYTTCIFQCVSPRQITKLERVIPYNILTHTHVHTLSMVLSLQFNSFVLYRLTAMFVTDEQC